MYKINELTNKINAKIKNYNNMINKSLTRKELKEKDNKSLKRKELNKKG